MGRDHRYQCRTCVRDLLRSPILPLSELLRCARPVPRQKRCIVYDDSYKLIARNDGKDEAYNLTLDPAEERNLLLSPNAELARRLPSMRAAIASLPPARPGADARANAQDFAALRALGYISPRR